MAKARAKAKKSAAGPVVSLLRGRKVAIIKKIAEEHVKGSNPNLNQGVIPKAEWEKMVATFKETPKVDRKPLPHTYVPVVVQLARSAGSPFAVSGQKSANKRAPSGWNANTCGAHEPGMKIIEFRHHHTEDVRKLVNDAENNIIKFGNYEYVVGTSKVAAPHLVNAARSGNYAHNIEIGKKFNFSGVADINNLVGQFNNRVVVEVLEDGSEIVWLPNQTITWGYFMNGNTELTPAAIRKLDGNMKGIKFVVLSEPIIGKGIDRATWWKAVKHWVIRGVKWFRCFAH